MALTMILTQLLAELSTELFTALEKRYNSAQTQKTRARLRQQAATDARASRNDSKIYKEWIRSYEEEQKKGVAILHRIKALKALSSTSKPGGGDSHSKSSATDPPPYTSTTIDEMIAELKLLYRKHLKALQEIVEWPPTGGRDGDYHEFEFLRVTYNRQGQTLAWEEHQYTCAMRGGCCGRSCGCCGRPLQELYIPLSNGRRRKGGVYGHCTAECLCCNLFYGCYKPDARLPEIDPHLLMAVAG